jgi:hypothetical protein
MHRLATGLVARPLTQRRGPSLPSACAAAGCQRAVRVPAGAALAAAGRHEDACKCLTAGAAAAQRFRASKESVTLGARAGIELCGSAAPEELAALRDAQQASARAVMAAATAAAAQRQQQQQGAPRGAWTSSLAERLKKSASAQASGAPRRTLIGREECDGETDSGGPLAPPKAAAAVPSRELGHELIDPRHWYRSDSRDGSLHPPGLARAALFCASPRPPSRGPRARGGHGPRKRKHRSGGSCPACGPGTGGACR